MESKHFQEVVAQLRNMPTTRKTTMEEEYLNRIRCAGSLALLYMEYLRRCAIWTTELGNTYKYASERPMSFLYLFNKDWVESEVLHAYEREFRFKFQTVEYGLYLYLAWHFYRDEIAALGMTHLPDPIEPLWVYMLRGGFIITGQASEPTNLSGLHLCEVDRDKLWWRPNPFIDCHDELSLMIADEESLADREAFLDKYITPYARVIYDL